MRTKKQEELINSYLATLDEGDRVVYAELIGCLSELGYNPQKQRSSIVFKHDSHNKQIAKIGSRKGTPFFQLRFSACRGYSKRFDDVVRDAIARTSVGGGETGCLKGECSWCAGEPMTHVYIHNAPNGETKYHCGAALLGIPNIGAEDIEETERLIREEHAYLMKHQAGITV